MPYTPSIKNTALHPNAVIMGVVTYCRVCSRDRTIENKKNTLTLSLFGNRSLMILKEAVSPKAMQAPINTLVTMRSSTCCAKELMKVKNP
jgi:hypothetical protein